MKQTSHNKNEGKPGGVECTGMINKNHGDGCLRLTALVGL